MMLSIWVSTIWHFVPIEARCNTEGRWPEDLIRTVQRPLQIETNSHRLAEPMRCDFPEAPPKQRAPHYYSQSGTHMMCRFLTLCSLSLDIENTILPNAKLVR